MESMSFLTQGLAVGDRVKLHPATDAFMVGGDRYGTIEKIGRKYVHVRGQWSGRTWKLSPHVIDLAPER